MAAKVLIEIDARHEVVVRRALALAEELGHLALTAPDGAVLDACERAVVEHGRRFQAAVLGQAVARRIEAAEKKGPRSAPAGAAGPRRTGGRRSGS